MAKARNRPRRALAWLLCLMLLAFLVCSIGLAHAEADTTSSTIPGSDLVATEREPDNDGDAGRGDDVAGENEDADRDDDVMADRADRDDDVMADRADRDDSITESSYEDAIATDSLDDDHVDSPAPASIEATSHAPTWAHGVDAREAALRQHASWLGRIDVSITWRRAFNESTQVQRDEVWLVGTWRL